MSSNSFAWHESDCRAIGGDGMMGSRWSPGRWESGCAGWGHVMPVFMIERGFSDEFEPSVEAADGINRINDEESVRWLYSFLAADRHKLYCLYEAPSVDAIHRAAARAGLPVDVVIEVSHGVNRRGGLEPAVEGVPDR